MKTFQEILYQLEQGERVRRKSWSDPKLYFEIGEEDQLVSSIEGVFLQFQDYQAADWELYKEPIPNTEPEKTLGQFIASVFHHSYTPDNNLTTGLAWESKAKQIEAEVLRRHRESLPKIDGKTPGQVLFEIEGFLWDAFDERTRQKKEYTAASFLSAYRFAPTEPKRESAVERLFNSGFTKPRLTTKLNGECLANFKSFSKDFEGEGETHERAAAAAIDKFKNFIAGR